MNRDKMSILIKAVGTFSIIAVAVLFLVLGGMTTGSKDYLNLAIDISIILIFASVIIGISKSVMKSSDKLIAYIIFAIIMILLIIFINI